jgi:hypothetical protein
MSTTLRPELPTPIPTRILELPVNRGYPVPWFVSWTVPGPDGSQRSVAPGTGEPDFRVVFPGAVPAAMKHRLCWICGGHMPYGASDTFVIGPMCAVNRTSAEPPSHLECADWSARACPFLSRPHMVRREAGLPENRVEPSGMMLSRNPGVALVWTSKFGTWRIKRDPNGGVLFDLGEPLKVAWYAEGRPATRDEIMESIESGLPALLEVARQEEGAEAELQAMLARALEVVPA